PEQLDRRLKILSRFELKGPQLAVVVEMGFPARRPRSGRNAGRLHRFLLAIAAVALWSLACRHRFLLCAAGKIPRSDDTAKFGAHLLMVKRHMHLFSYIGNDACPLCSLFFCSLSFPCPSANGCSRPRSSRPWDRRDDAWAQPPAARLSTLPLTGRR